VKELLDVCHAASKGRDGTSKFSEYTIEISRATCKVHNTTIEISHATSKVSDTSVKISHALSEVI
jgi:hypothetical protein